MANTITDPTWIKAKPHGSFENQVGDADPSARPDVINRPPKGIRAVLRRVIETVWHDEITADMTDLTTTSRFTKGQSRLAPYNTFDGLVLGTHDDDTWHKRVIMRGAQAIWTNKGRRVKPRTNRVADITAAVGLGGLDAGTEGADTWYEIYYVFDDADNPEAPTTDGLVLHKQRAKVAGANNGTNNTSVGLRDAAARTRIAQGFKGITTNAIIGIVVSLWRTGTIAAKTHVWLEIQSDTAGAPSGTVLATSNKLDASEVHTAAAGDLKVFFFRDGWAPADTSTQYHFVLMADYGISAANFLNTRYQNTDVYANGAAQQWDGSSWTALGGVASDLLFQIHTIEPATALVLPTGYDEYALLGHVRNNGSSDFKRFMAHDRRVRCLGLDANWSIGTTTGTTAQLATVGSFIPYGRLRAAITAHNTAIGALMVTGAPEGGLQAASLLPFGTAALFIDTAGGYGPLGDIVTENQYLYWLVSAGTGTFKLTSYEWVEVNP